MKILIADTNPGIRVIIKKLLSRLFELNILECHCGSQVIQTLEREIPDIIIMNIYLNGVGGITLSSRIKKLSDKIHIILLFNDINEEYLQLALDLEAGVFLDKRNLFELPLMINNWINKNKEMKGNHNEHCGICIK